MREQPLKVSRILFFMTRLCKKCGQWKELEAFGYDHEWRRHVCQLCWRPLKAAKARALMRRIRASETPDERLVRLEKARLCRLRNRENSRKAVLRWNRENRERYLATKRLGQQNRIARRKGFPPVEPLSRGGAHHIDNLVPACRHCNATKRNTPLLVWLARRVKVDAEGNRLTWQQAITSHRPRLLEEYRWQTQALPGLMYC